MTPQTAQQPTKTAQRVAARFVPENSRAVPYEGIAAVVYVYLSKDGKPAALAYKGTARKPAFHLRFGTEGALLEYVRKWVEGHQAREQRRQAEQVAKRDETHTLTVGAVLVSSWGYEQTNVDFFEVVRVVSPKTVELRQIAATLNEDDTPGGAMTGYKMPTRGAFLADEPVMTLRARGERVHGIRRGGHTASLWDGKPQRCSWYA